MSGDPVSFIPPSFQINYESAWDMAFQQTDSSLRDSVMTRTGVTGKVWTGPIIDDFEMTDDLVRGGDTVLSDLTSEIWNVFPKAAYDAKEIARWDREYLHQISQPDSEIAQAQAYAVARLIDNRIVAAATGIAQRGENGTTAVALPSTQIVAATYQGQASPTAGPLNWYKISRAKFLLDQAEVPMGGRTFVLDAENMEALVNDVIANHSGEIASIKGMNTNQGSAFLLENGLLSFRFVQSERVLRDSSDVVTCLAYHKSAIRNGIWGDRKTQVDRIPTRKQALQIYTDVNANATRSKDRGVVSVLADMS